MLLGGHGGWREGMEEVGRWRKMLRRAAMLLTMAAAATMDDRQGKQDQEQASR
jgi:hypothetical protein